MKAFQDTGQGRSTLSGVLPLGAAAKAVMDAGEEEGEHTHGCEILPEGATGKAPSTVRVTIHASVCTAILEETDSQVRTLMPGSRRYLTCMVELKPHSPGCKVHQAKNS
jgi:hypothetical protein